MFYCNLDYYTILYYYILMSFLKPTVKLDPNGKILTALNESLAMRPVPEIATVFNSSEIPPQFNRFITRTREQLIPALCKPAGHLALTIIDSTLDVVVRSFVEGLDEEGSQRDQLLDHLLYLVPTAEKPKSYRVRSSAQLAYAHHPELVDLRDAIKNVLTTREDLPETGPTIVHQAAGFAVSQLDKEYWDFLITGQVDTNGLIEDISTLLDSGEPGY
jgi:hypothetical protein